MSSQRRILKKLYEKQKKFFRRMGRVALSKLFSYNLDKLAVINKTDKGRHHWYTRQYKQHFHALRKRKLRVLEIGVGGYSDPGAGGSSLRMWKHYFPQGKIYAIDICDKSRLQEKRIEIFKGSQIDADFLKGVLNKTGPLDIIIDDGSHVSEHVVTTFKILFPLLKAGGIYAIEDTQTSYWPQYGGDSQNLNNPATLMNFFKSLSDGLNYQEYKKPGYQPGYLDKNIASLHFYHNLIFIYKTKT